MNTYRVEPVQTYDVVAENKAGLEVERWSFLTVTAAQQFLLECEEADSE